MCARLVPFTCDRWRLLLQFGFTRGKTRETAATYKLIYQTSEAVNRSSKRNNPKFNYRHRVLKISDGVEHVGEMQWEIALALLISWVVLYFALWKGIKWTGKVTFTRRINLILQIFRSYMIKLYYYCFCNLFISSPKLGVSPTTLKISTCFWPISIFFQILYVTTTAPYVFMIILLIRGATLPGSLEGIKYYLVPDLSKLKNTRVWNNNIYGIIPPSHNNFVKRK